MTVGANQPYLFPYLAYWQLMNVCDIYVIADSMQYIKQGFINRNSILVNQKKQLFTLEVLGLHADTPINALYVGKNRKKLLKSFFYAYKRAPYFEDVYPLIEDIILNNEENLAQYISHSIKSIAGYLGIETEFVYLSELQGETSLKGQERGIDFCKRLGATRFINAIGGQELYSKEDFLKEGIVLHFLKMDEIVYTQFNDSFISNLSIVDVMMFNSKEEVQKMLKKFELV